MLSVSKRTCRPAEPVFLRQTGKPHDASEGSHSGNLGPESKTTDACVRNACPCMATRNPLKESLFRRKQWD